jgi:hypothetical protein
MGALINAFSRKTGIICTQSINWHFCRTLNARAVYGLGCTSYNYVENITYSECKKANNARRKKNIVIFLVLKQEEKKQIYSQA